MRISGALTENIRHCLARFAIHSRKTKKGACDAKCEAKEHFSEPGVGLPSPSGVKVNLARHSFCSENSAVSVMINIYFYLFFSGQFPPALSDSVNINIRGTERPAVQRVIVMGKMPC